MRHFKAETLTVAAIGLLALAPLAAGSIPDTVDGEFRGYLTTPQELREIRSKADQGLSPYRRAVEDVLSQARRSWDFRLEAVESCGGADDPRWIDNDGGIPIVYAKALAYHLTGEGRYAEEVRQILQRIMSQVKQISERSRQCQLNFGWGTPELVASADLIDDHFRGQSCTGPASTVYGENSITTGDCKQLFQNWLVKNPYYIVSMTHGINNWGTAAAVTTGSIADYLWDRPEVRLVHRNPRYINSGESFVFTPAEAFAHVKQHMLESMKGHAVSYGSSRSCDLMGDSPDQDPRLGPPVKSQITENGILPADARRQEKCNISRYNGNYQNYPQINLDNLTAYCELLWRRGDRSCYDNVENSDIPNFTFRDKNGRSWTTHLRPGRGSLERAINAVIIDAGTEWKREGGLTVAYRYYRRYKRLAATDLSKWGRHIETRGAGDCSQSICYGGLTHGFSASENPGDPPTVPPPGGSVGQDPGDDDEPLLAPIDLAVVEVVDDPPPSPPPGSDADAVLTDDARVSRKRQTRNYGDSDFLRLRDGSSGWRSFLKFAVSGLKGRPAKALLRLYVTDPSPSGGAVHRVSNALQEGGGEWSEGNLTWANAPEITDAALATLGSVSEGSWVEFDVTSAITQDGAYSFALLTQSGNSVLYSSREGSHPPQLVIEE